MLRVVNKIKGWISRGFLCGKGNVSVLVGQLYKKTTSQFIKPHYHNKVYNF